MEEEIEVSERRGTVPTAWRRRFFWGTAAVAIVGLTTFGAWVASSGVSKAWGAVAVVEGKRISRAELEQHMAFLGKQGRLRPEVLADLSRKQEAERFALDDLITRRLLLSEAERLKIAVEPGEEELAFRKAHGGKAGDFRLAEAAKKAGEDVERMRQEVRRQLLMTRVAEKITERVSVSDEDVARYYATNRQKFAAPATARLRLLIVDAKQEAERLRGAAVKGADFASLVRQFSKGGNKESGGDMGWVDPRMLPSSLATAVAGIPETGVTPVIEARGGFYLIRVEGRQAARQLPLSEVKDQVKQILTAERKQATFTEWLQERRRAARIKIYL